jgi:hypothetical protein
MRTLAKELVGLNPEVIVGATTPAVAALVQETMFMQVIDPLGGARSHPSHRD